MGKSSLSDYIGYSLILYWMSLRLGKERVKSIEGDLTLRRELGENRQKVDLG